MPSVHDRLHHDPSGRDALDHARMDYAFLEHGRLLRERLSTATAKGHEAGGEDEGTESGAPAPGATRDPAREALERTCLTVKRIAQDIGMPRATLEAYRLGTRRMPQVARVRLGTYLAAHAAMLDDLAQALKGPNA